MAGAWEEVGIFAGAFAVSALAGLAALLRSDAVVITRKSVAAYTLNAGVLGLGLCMLWYARFHDNVYSLIGVCVLAGLGGMATIDVVVQTVWKRLGGKEREGDIPGVGTGEPNHPKGDQ